MAKYSVFISHAHTDNKVCDVYSNKLREQGVDVWYDRTNMEYADMITEIIGNELKKRTALIIMLTKTSVKSKWVLLEISTFFGFWAKDAENRIILPVLLEDCEIPPILNSFKFIDGTLQSQEDIVKELTKKLIGKVAPIAPPVQVGTRIHTNVPQVHSIEELIIKWIEYTENKWYTINNTQLGREPMRGRWNNWTEVFLDTFAPPIRSDNIIGESIIKRYNLSSERGATSSAVSSFLYDLYSFRETFLSLLQEITVDAEDDH